MNDVSPLVGTFYRARTMVPSPTPLPLLYSRQLSRYRDISYPGANTAVSNQKYLILRFTHASFLRTPRCYYVAL